MAFSIDGRYQWLQVSSKRLTRLTVFLYLCLLMTLSGCAGTGSPYSGNSSLAGSVDPSHREHISREQIFRLIREESPAQAIQNITAHRTRNMFDDRELDLMYQEAVEQLVLRFHSALEEQEYYRAISHYQSLETLEKTGSAGDWDLPALYRALADGYAEDDNPVGALSSLLRIEDFTALDDAVLTAYGKMAVRANHRHAAERIMRVLEERGAELPEELKTVAETTPDPSRMVTGTVTIWVNRGIRIDRGVGRPDRVIGTGFFVDPRGYLVTNYHVIESEVDPGYSGYSRLYIRPAVSPDQRIPARVVGYDRIFDIALLKVEIDPPFIFSFTDIRELRPGSSVIAIGSPGGLSSSVTSGIISATGRRFLQLGDAMQVDVPINPGNSGGPLINPQGELVGVVFAGIPQFEGVNFAIPSFWLNTFLADLYNEGEVRHPWIGASVHETVHGLLVSYVTRGGPAHEAGIEPGDVITSLNGYKVRRVAEAQNVLLDLRTDTLISIEWRRGDEDRKGYVTTAPRPFSPVEDALKRESETALFPALFGMNVDDVSTLPWQKNYVIRDIYPGTIADETGLSRNDPFTLRDFGIDTDNRIAYIQIIVRKKTAGFLESGVQLAALLEPDNFL
jgi:serine protease Do